MLSMVNYILKVVEKIDIGFYGIKEIFLIVVKCLCLIFVLWCMVKVYIL